MRRHREAPWLTPEAVGLLDRLVRPTDRVFEWGSGRSTRWFAERAAAVISIETNPVWHATVERSLTAFPHARSHLLQVSETSSQAEIAAYCSALGDLVPGPFDVVLVDGLFRDRCASRAVDYVAAGGLLIVDDVGRYLPSGSRSPVARRDFASEQWRCFSDRVAGWRSIWTTSGVTDTAVWIQPGAGE